LLLVEAQEEGAHVGHALRVQPIGGSSRMRSSGSWSSACARPRRWRMPWEKVFTFTVGASSKTGLFQAGHDLLALQPQPRETAQQSQVCDRPTNIVKNRLVDQGADPAQNAVVGVAKGSPKSVMVRRRGARGRAGAQQRAFARPFGPKTPYISPALTWRYRSLPHNAPVPLLERPLFDDAVCAVSHPFQGVSQTA